MAQRRARKYSMPQKTKEESRESIKTIKYVPFQRVIDATIKVMEVHKEALKKLSDK